MSELEPNLPGPQAGSPPPIARGKAQRITMPSNPKAKTARIFLEDNPDIPPTGQFIGVNGNHYLLKPGVWADVPLAIVEVLDHAVTKIPELDPITKQVIGWRERLRYPYRTQHGQ